MSRTPAIMICVGATKAGTSSLYKYLHDHNDCYVRSVKELQYFSTVDFDDYAHQYDTLDRARLALVTKQEKVQAEGDQWRVKNLQRQINDVDEIKRVISLGEQGIPDYLFYLLDGIEDKKLATDITPAYSRLSVERLKQMAKMAPDVRFVYLMRDPVDRLWSHVRMLTERRLQKPENAGQDFAKRARDLLNATIKRGTEPHILERGDYKSTLEKLRAAVPEKKLFVGFSETTLRGEGLEKLCAFLGITYSARADAPHRHKGVELSMNDGQRRRACEVLAPQYAYVEENYGPLPQRWQANMARV